MTNDTATFINEIRNLQDQLTTMRMVEQINEVNRNNLELQAVARRAVDQTEKMAAELAIAAETLSSVEHSHRKDVGKFMALARFLHDHHNDVFEKASFAAYIDKNDIAYLKTIVPIEHG